MVTVLVLVFFTVTVVVVPCLTSTMVSILI
jgi:hypothetical protein